MQLHITLQRYNFKSTRATKFLIAKSKFHPVANLLLRSVIIIMTIMMFSLLFYLFSLWIIYRYSKIIIFGGTFRLGCHRDILLFN